MALQWKAFVEWGGTASKNLCTNPSFESNTTSWAQINGTAIARDNTYARYGSYALKGHNTGSGQNQPTFATVSVTNGVTYTFSVWVYIPSSEPTLTNAAIRIMSSADFTIIATADFLAQANATRNQWFRVAVTYTESATTTRRLNLFFSASAAHAEWIDGAQMEAGSTATPYYDGTVGDESDPLMEVRIARGRKHLVRNADGLEPMGIGDATLLLRNVDGRYDPLNTNSPLYPAVTPGKVVRLWLSDGTEYAMFTGHIVDIKPIGSAQSKRVQIIVKDGWQWLRDVKVRLAAQTTYRTDQAINAVRAAAAYPFSSEIYTGVDKIPYWYAGNKDAASEIQSVVDSEFGLVWISGDGTLRFRRRPYQWLLSATHTLTGANINELEFAQPWEVVRNVIQIRVYPTEIRTKQVLWKLNAPIKVRPGKTVTLRAKYNLRTNQDQTGIAINERTAALSLEVPAPSTDYIINSNPQGLVDDVTNKIVVVATNLGSEAQIQITNNATRTVYVSSLQIRGRVIIQNNVVTVEKDNSGSDPERTFVLDVPWQQSIEKARLYADYLAEYMADPRAAPTIRTNRAGLAIQCAELFTGYQFNISALGLSNKLYRLCGVEHQWSAQSPNLLDTKMYLERKDETAYITLGTYELGDAEGLAY